MAAAGSKSCSWSGSGHLRSVIQASESACPSCLDFAYDQQWRTVSIRETSCIQTYETESCTRILAQSGEPGRRSGGAVNMVNFVIVQLFQTARECARRNCE